MTFSNAVWLIPLLPLIGAAANGIVGKRLPRVTVSLIGCGTVGISFMISAGIFVETLRAEDLPRIVNYFTWIQAGGFEARFGVLIDHLSVLMILVVTGVGFLIHLYSIGYMEHDSGYYRYFAYLNLFTFSMLTLVLANNYLLMFVGWEGVGLCSYLLIGFWFHKKSAADAGKKAFVVNRVGDFGFMLATILIFWTFQSVDFQTVFDRVRDSGIYPPETFGAFGVLTGICLLMLVGATGKSAQIPLYVWLPDAMEGPTPVSALIHAATMVTAGVYMVARSAVLFDHAPTALFTVAVVGAATAIFAASIGLVQTDIKRVLAYSTVSQLGYMFLACGVGAYAAGVFHLMTHAFFKALLFLGSGSVIHGLGGEQDLRKMGGLRKQMPVTHVTFVLGTLAITGMPLLAGFFSKDEILWRTYNSEHLGPLLWEMGAVAAFFTSFYMFRLVFLAFYGEARAHTHHPAHESPKSMLIPLIVLAALSVAGGYVGVPAVLGGGNQIEQYLAPAIGHAGAAAESSGDSHGFELLLMGVSVAIAFGGLALAFVFYIARPHLPSQLAQSFEGGYRALLNKYYIDEVYDLAIVRPTVFLSREVLWRGMDSLLIDGSINTLGRSVRGAGATLRYIQAGYVRGYVGWILLGGLFVMVWLLR